MGLQIKDNQKIVFGPPTGTVDARGNPTTVDNIVVTSSDPSVLPVTISADGSGEAPAAGPLGKVVLTMTADADPGSGVMTITGTLEVEVIPGDAVAVNFNVTSIEDQVAAPAPGPGPVDPGPVDPGAVPAPSPTA